jgi:hypothetical protein
VPVKAQDAGACKPPPHKMMSDRIDTIDKLRKESINHNKQYECMPKITINLNGLTEFTISSLSQLTCEHMPEERFFHEGRVLYRHRSLAEQGIKDGDVIFYHYFGCNDVDVPYDYRAEIELARLSSISK